MPRYTFDPFLLDTGARTLVRAGEPVPISGKTFDTLAVLVQNRGRLMDKDELLSRVWPGTVVEEANLSQAVFTVRKILGDSPKDPRFIATIPGRGYQFVAPVTELTNQAPEREAPNKRHRKAAVGSFAVLAALAALTWFLLPRPPKPSTEVTEKRLTFNTSESPVQSAAISPDGKYLAYSDSAGIHVKLLLTGEERLIPKPAEVPASAYWFVTSWFPHGAQLLAAANEPGGHKSIWTVSVLGQSPRKLREGAVAWEASPDGTRIAFETTDHTRELWVTGIHGDDLQKVLAVPENESLFSLHWSPDGRRLAYIRVRRISDKSLYSIETCDLKGESRTVVMPAEPGQGFQNFCWLSDGRIIYARDDNLWQIGIDNPAATPTGKPKRITRLAGSDLWAMSASADGKRLVILKQMDQAQAYLAELTEAGTRMKPPRHLTNDEAVNYPSAWTADSQTVLSWSNRNGKSGIYKQGINQDVPEPVYIGPRDAEGPRLSADGRWILFFENPTALMRIPTNGGVPQLVLENRNSIDTMCARAPASLCVVVELSQDRKHLTITTFDPVKGRGKVLRTIEKDPAQEYAGTALSPDGSTYAVSQSRETEIHIRLLSLSGGSDREIRVKGWPNNTNLDWTSDGKGFYVGSQSPQALTLLYVDLKGNARVLWQYKGQGSQIWGVPSPDGRYLAILATGTNSNVWMLEGF